MNNVLTLRHTYYAGSQRWFLAKSKFSQDYRIRQCGCGVIAMVDFCIYKGLEKRPESRQEYMRAVRRMEKRNFRLFPGLGISPYLYPFFMNLYFRFHRIPYRIRSFYGYLQKDGGQRLISLVEEQLRQDMPLIFAAGPQLPIPGRIGRVPLYRMAGQNMELSGAGAKSHYMTITGILRQGEDVYIQLASWGELWYMRPGDYLDYGKYTIPFTNVIYRAEGIKTGMKRRL